MRGIAVDQATQDVYVTIVSGSTSTVTPGRIERFNSDLSADGTFANGLGHYSGVALNPLSPGAFLGAQVEMRSPLGTFGTTRLDRFSSSGSLLGSFALPFTDSLPPIVTDAAGRIFFPNVDTNSVRVYDQSGTLLEEITCAGCPGGQFGDPASVALNAAGDLYVADANPDRVVKLTSSGGPYSFSSMLQSGRGAGAVAVDSGTGDVLVADMPNGRDYHVVAYDSAGVQVDDFGAGLFPDSVTGYGALSAYQMAVNATTHKLYVGEFDKFYVFEKTTIDPPSATTGQAADVTQLGATLKATVNANGHAVLECRFEYTDEADFQANGFDQADSSTCPELPDGSSNMALSVQASGLLPGTAYRYRVTAASSGGSSSSDDESFETLPALPPAVATHPPQGVGQSSAILEGSVDPQGGAVSDCHFELGTTAAYGSSVPCSASPGPVTADVEVSGSVGGLPSGTVHHYRLVVSTNAGTTAGDDVEFTTASPPPEPETAPPPVAALPPIVQPVPAPPTPQCRKGFRRQSVRGVRRCVKICRKGFRRKSVRGKVRCVRLRRRGSR